MVLTKSDLQQIGSVVDNKLQAGLKPIKKELRYIRRTVEVLIGRSDREETLLKRRVSKIERHLGLPSEN